MKHPDKFEYWAEEMEKLPIIYQNYFGSTDPDKIITLIEYCIYTFDVGHIILDNL